MKARDSTTNRIKILESLTGLVAQISGDGKIILAVYRDKSVAMREVGISSSGAITLAVARGHRSAGYYWKMYEDCNDDLKATYTKELPAKLESPHYSKSVHQIDIETGEIIATHKSMVDICNKFRASHKQLHKSSEHNTPYKGFYWKIF